MRLADLNPLRDLPNRREVLAWALYDLANQSFTVLINTVFFALYFKEHVVGDARRAAGAWGLAVGLSNAAVLVCAPLFGAMADHRRAKKKALLGLTISCVALTAALGLIPPTIGGAAVILGVVYALANFCFASAESFISAFLPEIAPPGAIARISAFGWTLGYVGTLLVLPASLLIIGAGDITTAEHRRVFVFAAAWFAVNSLPAFLFVRERAPDAERIPGAGRPLLIEGFSRLRQTARDAARYRQLLRFLGVFAVYSCGTQAVIYFATIVAKASFGFSDTQAVYFMLQLGLTAGIGSFFAGALQRRLGHRGVILIVLALWTVSTLAAWAIPKRPDAEWMFWVVGNGVGLALGAIGASSRAIVGAFTPADKSAEFFGLWAMAYRLAGVVGPAAFGGLAGVAGIGPALGLIVCFFALGLAGMFLVNEREGERAAGWARPVAPPPPSAFPR